MDNKYFIPDIEDIRVGYECEIQRELSLGIMPYLENRVEFSSKWEQVVVGRTHKREELLTPESLEKLFNDIWYPQPNVDKCRLYIQHKKLRVPYLTKEQIIAEGWEDITKDEYKGNWAFEKGNWFAAVNIDHSRHPFILRIMVKDPSLENEVLGASPEYFRFSAPCKDINTFRYLCKLLDI